MTEQPDIQVAEPSGYVLTVLNSSDKTELLDLIAALAMRVRELERRVAELTEKANG